MNGRRGYGYVRVNGKCELSYGGGLALNPIPVNGRREYVTSISADRSSIPLASEYSSSVHHRYESLD